MQIICLLDNCLEQYVTVQISFFKQLCKTGNEPRKKFLLNQMAAPWNNISKEIDLWLSANSFKV